MNHWLIKSEPEEYSFEDLKKEKKTEWTGVRNYAARIHLNAMKKGDICLYYHSISEKAIVGLCVVSQEAGKWVAVEVSYLKPLVKPVLYSTLKAMEHMKKFDLIRISRLSVMPVSDQYWYEIMEMSETSI